MRVRCTSFLDQSQEIQHFKMAAIKEVYTKNLAEARKEVARRWPGSDRAPQHRRRLQQGLRLGLEAESGDTSKKIPVRFRTKLSNFEKRA